MRKSRTGFAVGTAALCLVTLVAGAAGAGRSELSFAPGPPVPAGPAPMAAAVADLNGDGKLDAVMGNGGYWNDVRVLLGDGAGGFREHGFPLVVGPYPRWLTSADFNGDGKADVAVATRGDNLVKTLLGDGSGGLASTASVAAGGDPVGLAQADLNGDGKKDLVVPVWRNGYRLRILLGDGAGGFAPPSELAMVGSNEDSPRLSVVAADLTGDGKPDLAAALSKSTEVWLWRGDGAGGFAPRETMFKGSNPGPLAVGDVNGDGRSDLVAGVGKGLVTLLGDGKGAFRQAGPPAAVRGGSLTLADLNGDGKLDVAASDGGVRARVVSVATGDGSGRFEPVGLSPFAVIDPAAITAGDFNGDGKLDLFTLSWIGEAWWPSPSGTAVLLQTSATPAVPAPPARLPRGTLLETRTPVELLAANAGRAAAVTARDKHGCGPVVVWNPDRNAVRSFKRSYLGCEGDGVSELALNDRQVAWIEEGGGNDLELSVMLGKLTGRAAKQVDYETNGDRAGGDPTGDWVGQLQGGGSVLAYNAWDVTCSHVHPGGEYCDWVGVDKSHLVELSSGRRRVVRSGPDSYPLAAVGGGRMAVATGGAVRVYGRAGSLVTSVSDPGGDPARAVALSSSRLAIERTFGLDLYSPTTGTKTASLGLGPAASLRLTAVSSKLALLRGRRRLVLVRLADGRLASLPLVSHTGQPLVDVRLTDAGLFFAYNVKKSAKKGHVAFVSTATLLRRF